MLATLNIVLGLIFVILLFSLLTSTVMEVIAAALSLRSKHLESFLRTMLVEHFDKFMEHPLFKQIANATSRKTRISNYEMPSWINKDTFTAIVGDMLDVRDPAILRQRIENLDEGEVKSLLQFLMRRTGGDPTAFIQEMEYWFDEMMERASSWYKRKMKWWLFSVGLILAAIFNVDTIKTYQAISTDTALQELLAAEAVRFESSTDSVANINMHKSLEESVADMKAAREQLEGLDSRLGLGWESSETGDRDLPWWMVKIMGLLLTGIAVTFGAPFWFDLLKKVLSIRRTIAPQAAPATATPPAAPEAGSALEPPTSLTSERSLGPIDNDPNAPKMEPRENDSVD